MDDATTFTMYEVQNLETSSDEETTIHKASRQWKGPFVANSRARVVEQGLNALKFSCVRITSCQFSE